METNLLDDSVAVLQHRIDALEDLLAQKGVLDPALFHVVQSDLATLAAFLYLVEKVIEHVSDADETGEDGKDTETDGEEEWAGSRSLGAP